MPYGKQNNIVISERVLLKCNCGNKCRILTRVIKYAFAVELMMVKMWRYCIIRGTHFSVCATTVIGAKPNAEPNARNQLVLNKYKYFSNLCVGHVIVLICI